MEWASSKPCRSVLVEMVHNPVAKIENRLMAVLVNNVIEESWRRIEVKRLVDEITNSDEEIQQRVEILLSEKGREKRDLLVAVEMEEGRQIRLRRIETIKMVWERKMEAKNLKKMLKMLRQLTISIYHFFKQ